MRRNIVASLFEHETISTTLEKAKEVKAFAEKLITLAKQGTLSARRRAIALLGNRDILGDENGKVIKKGTVIGKLFSELGPRYLDRPGGYTRIIHLAMRRLGDNGQLVLLQLVGAEEKWRKEKEERKGRKAKGSAEEAEEEYNEAVEEEAVEGAVETEEEAAKNEEATEGAEKQE
jgi:large subunit ribosomal protein L17